MPRTTESAAHEIASSCHAYRLRVINRSITRLYDEALREFGITVAQLNLLVATTMQGPLRAADLVSALSIERSTLSRNLARLRSLELIEDVEGEDARSQPMRATTKGRRLLERILPVWREVQQETEELLGSALTGRLDAAMRRARKHGTSSTRPTS